MSSESIFSRERLCSPSGSGPVLMSGCRASTDNLYCSVRKLYKYPFGVRPFDVVKIKSLILLNISPAFCFDKRFDPRRTYLLFIIAELRRPEGPPSGAPYPYRKEKETHESYPWVYFLMVIMASGTARGRVRTTTTAAAMVSRNMAAIHQILG